MWVHIIEDDPLKCSRLEQFIVERYPALGFSAYGSFNSGLKAIEENKPDFVLLDMTLPTFDRRLGAREGRLRPLGGYELLSKLRLKGISTRVIVITGLVAFGEADHKISFEEVDQRCRKEFSGLFQGMIYYQQSDLEWCERLEILINGILKELNNA